MKKILMVCFLVYGLSGQSFAQQNGVSAQLGIPPAISVTAPVDYNVPFRETLFFSPAELTLIEQAKNGSVVSTAALGVGGGQVIPQRRSIFVSGVVYREVDDWVVWINGYRVSPGRLLPQIVDIQVEDDKVHLKWFDIGINDVISITLRPHQTYEIVTGVLLTGRPG